MMTDATKHSRYEFIWKIKNFLSCHIAQDENIISPTFEVADQPGRNWELSLYPKGQFFEFEEVNNQIIAYLSWKRPQGNSESFFPIVLLEMLNVDGSILLSESRKNLKTMCTWICFFHDLCYTMERLHKLMKNWDEDTLTIRCIMANSMNQVEDEIQSTQYQAVTVIDVERFVFEWDVSNTGCLDWSENVSVSNSVVPDLKIILSAPDEAVNIEIQVLSEPSNKLAMFRIRFLSISGIKLGSKCEVHLFESTDSWLFPTFISKKDLLFGNCLSPCYKYIFICECSVSQRSFSSSKIEKLTFNYFVKSELKSVASFPSSLQHDFRELYINKKHSDVKLRLGSIDFIAHKTVLATRSPVFSAMFDQDMLENQTGVVKIEDMDKDTVEKLLHFMYTDIVSEMDCESALKLSLAADKYQILNLKDKCSSIILSLLSVENVCEVIVLADMINDASVKTYALNFICANVSEVLSAPNWCSLVEKNMKLATEIMFNLSEYVNRRINFS